jgi:large subunit ribosomal protein L15
MNTFLSILPKIVKGKSKRLGRGPGSGKGAKSGRGTTRHQAARENIPIHFEGGQGRFVKKFPLLRGKLRNRSYQLKPLALHLADLNVYNDGDVVNLTTLLEKRIITDSDVKMGVKILADGKLEKKLTVAIPVSKTAKDMIEKAGGQLEG